MYPLLLYVCPGSVCPGLACLRTDARFMSLGCRKPGTPAPASSRDALALQGSDPGTYIEFDLLPLDQASPTEADARKNFAKDLLLADMRNQNGVLPTWGATNLQTGSPVVCVRRLHKVYFLLFSFVIGFLTFHSCRASTLQRLRALAAVAVAAATTALPASGGSGC